MSADHLTFITQVLQHAAGKLTPSDPPSSVTADNTGDDGLAASLGEQLGKIIESMTTTPSNDYEGECFDYGFGQDLPYEVLLTQNSFLAAALGACDCWGQRPDCRICRGRGTAGWAVPDARLFKRFVRPALLTLQGLRQVRSNGTRHTDTAIRKSNHNIGE